MPMDPSYVGLSYPPTTPYLVGREKIREFADAIGATDAIYHDPEAARALGYPDVVAPPTFPIVLTEATLAQLREDEGLGLDFSRVVHGDQRYVYRRPLHAGDQIVCVCSIEEITARAGNEFLTVRSELATVDGEPVLSATSKLVIRGE